MVCTTFSWHAFFTVEGWVNASQVAPPTLARFEKKREAFGDPRCRGQDRVKRWLQTVDIHQLSRYYPSYIGDYLKSQKKRWECRSTPNTGMKENDFEGFWTLLNWCGGPHLEPNRSPALPQPPAEQAVVVWLLWSFHCNDWKTWRAMLRLRNWKWPSVDD